MSAEPEIWKPIPGYEGAYEVSDLGRVRSLARLVRGCTHNGVEFLRSVPPRVLKPGPSQSGHLTVVLGRAGGSHGVHLLVLRAFVGPLPEGQESLHRDGNPANNRLSNLHYGTRSQNLIDIFYQKGRRLSRDQVLYVRKRESEGWYFGEKSELARRFGVSPTGISNILAGRNYSHVS